MCNCKEIEIGSYDNQIELLLAPYPQMVAYKATGSGDRSVFIDACIYEEVKSLLEKGITTTASCCGHNKVEGFISVIDSDIPHMKDMGYKVRYNNCRPNDEDSFHPKRVYIHPVFKGILDSFITPHRQ